MYSTTKRPCEFWEEESEGQRMAHPPRLLNRREVAELLGIKPTTLAHLHHHRHIDLPYALIGGAARYRLEDVEAYIERHTSTLTRRYRDRGRR